MLVFFTNMRYCILHSLVCVHTEWNEYFVVSGKRLSVVGFQFSVHHQFYPDCSIDHNPTALLNLKGLVKLFSVSH